MQDQETRDEDTLLTTSGEEDQPAPIFTRAGVSDGDATNGEFLSDMEYDEGDSFFEELGGVMEGKDVEDLHTPDLTND